MLIDAIKAENETRIKSLRSRLSPEKFNRSEIREIIESRGREIGKNFSAVEQKLEPIELPCSSELKTDRKFQAALKEFIEEGYNLFNGILNSFDHRTKYPKLISYLFQRVFSDKPSEQSLQLGRIFHDGTKFGPFYDSIKRFIPKLRFELALLIAKHKNIITDYCKLIKDNSNNPIVDYLLSFKSPDFGEGLIPIRLHKESQNHYFIPTINSKKYSISELVNGLEHHLTQADSKWQKYFWQKSDFDQFSAREVLSQIEKLEPRALPKAA